MGHKLPKEMTTGAILGRLTCLHKHYGFFTKDEKDYIQLLNKELEKRDTYWEPPKSPRTGRPPLPVPPISSYK